MADATPSEIWAVVSDVSRIGEWSHECRSGAWLGDAVGAKVGARFVGTNRLGRYTWSRTNEIITADAPHVLAWRTVPSRFYRDSTEWRIDLDPVDGGTRITQSFQVVRVPVVLSRLYPLIVPAHRGRTTGLTDDLRRLGRLAESGTRRDASAVRMAQPLPSV